MTPLSPQRKQFLVIFTVKVETKETVSLITADFRSVLKQFFEGGGVPKSLDT